MITAVAVSAAHTALISALLVQRSRRRRAEHALRTTQAALHSSCADARDLAGRLITTQESERHRLARDLHDNLGQKLALLCIDIQQLSLRVTSPPTEIAASVTRLLERATDIAGDVHCLSHDLHPPKLDTLGLVSALEGLCRDVSRQCGLRIEFRHRGVSRRVPPEAALCLFRSAQEALHNVVKHSGDTVAVVRIVGTARSIRLHVADGGEGFDRTSRTCAGLGLLSMRERAHLAGGRLSIHTAVGSGTRIVVTLPLNAEPRPSAESHAESVTSQLLRDTSAGPAAMQDAAPRRTVTAFISGLVARTGRRPDTQPRTEMIGSR